MKLRMRCVADGVKQIAMSLLSPLADAIDPVPGFWFRGGCFIIWGFLIPDQLIHHVIHQN